MSEIPLPVYAGAGFLFLKRYDVSWLLEDVGVCPRRISEIVLGKRSVMADTVLRLACCFEIRLCFRQIFS